MTNASASSWRRLFLAAVGTVLITIGAGGAQAVGWRPDASLGLGGHVLIGFGATSDEAVRPAGATGSCFFLPSGARQWCIGPGDIRGSYWDSVAACADVWRGLGRQRGWLFASEGNTDLGYARPIRHGYWKVSTAGGSMYLGSIQQRTKKRWDVYDRRRHLLGYATAPNPAAVGLLRLAANACFQ